MMLYDSFPSHSYVYIQRMNVLALSFIYVIFLKKRMEILDFKLPEALVSFFSSKVHIFILFVFGRGEEFIPQIVFDLESMKVFFQETFYPLHW